MEVMKNFKDISFEKKAFCLFLLIHFIVWTATGLIRTVLPTDALEGIYWGSLHDFGTPKHPPFAGWLTYWIYSVFKSDFSIYFVSQAFIIGGFYYIYKLGKIFLDEKRAMLSVILLEGCWVYSYITGYYGFNPDVILLCLFPLLTFVFYQCMTRSKNIDWINLGLITGLCFLNKYQTALLIIPMFIWALMFKREVFKNKMFYVSVLISFLLFLPHLMWLIKYDFFPFMYFESELNGVTLFDHIHAPLWLLLIQMSTIIGSFLIFVGLKFRQKSEFKLFKNLEKEKVWFLLLFYFFPLIYTVIMVGMSGAGRFRWGFEFLYLSTIMMFYFFPTKEISKEDFKFSLKFAYIIMALIFLGLGGLLSVEKNYRSRYPVQKVYSDLNAIWSQEYKTPLKYFGGYIEWTLPLTIYGKEHQQIILDTFGYKNPWIDENDLKKSGILIIGRKKKDIYKDTRKSCPYLKDDYVITPHPYSFELTNAFGQKRQYDIYYHIVPPRN